MWRKLFIEKLLSNDIRGAQAIKLNNLPKSIFKYRSISEHSLDNLKNDTVWISSVDKFDDPYDCFFALFANGFNSTYWSMISNKIKSKLIEQCKQKNHFLSQSDIEKINEAKSNKELIRIALSIDKKIPSEKHEEMINALESAATDVSEKYQTGRLRSIIQKNMGVCSFSETNLSLIMWRNYGDNHKGFCVEYDLTSIEKYPILSNCIFPVIYTHDLFDVTPYYDVDETKFNNLIGIVTAMHKSEEWDHEKEWRIILPLGERYCAGNFPMPKPKSVHIGMEAEKNEKYKILFDIASQKSIEEYVMKLRYDSYQLKSEPIEINKEQ